MDFVAMTT